MKAIYMAFKTLILPLFLLLSLVFFGCNRSDNANPRLEKNSDADSSLTSLEAAKIAAREKRWGDAKLLIHNALIEDNSDPNVLRLAAEITNAGGDPQTAIDFIVAASIADEFRDERLVQQATIGFISVGKLFEAIDFLEQVVAAFPERHAARRQLFDFLVNAEEKHRATPHGRILVRQRQFDRVLLLSLSMQSRDMETESMAMLHERNPGDARLNLAKVRSSFDRGKWEQLEEMLDEILEQSPNNIAAQILLGRYFVASDQIDRLSAWSTRLSPSINQTWQYWDILGDWASAREQHQQAVRAYWESTRRNLDVGEVFSKLATTLVIARNLGEPIDQEMIKAVNSRAQLISRFDHDKDRFYKMGNRSNAIAAEVAESLLKLGRYWEAEAWAAFAMTIPDKDIEKVKLVRKKIVARLDKETPWQVSKGHPIVDLDLSHFPAPEVERMAPKSSGTPAIAFHPSIAPVLENQAIARGLIYDSAKDPKPVDQAIPIFAQMESGGCAIDFDQDGWADLYIAESGGTPGKQNSKANHLFRNRNGKFDDVTQNAGVADSGFAQGVTFGDVNEDGFSDLVVLNYGTNRLFINNGDGTFRRADEWFSRQNATVWSTSAAIADLNGDGISDLFCSRYCDGIDAVQTACQDSEGNESPCLPTKFAAAQDQFLAGTPAGGFEDMADRWTDPPGQLGRGLGVVAGSLDSKPGVDLFVANDMTSNHFWSSSESNKTQDSPLTFVESATLRGLAFDGGFNPQACMGIATGDLDEDGDVDFYVTNFEQEHNTFYEQTTQDIWSDRTTQRGIRQTSFFQLGFGTQAIDFDNDSHLELMVANGHVYRGAEPPSSYFQKMQILRRSSMSGYEAIDLTRSGAYFNRSHIGRALWTIDANQDGRIDAAVTHQSEPFALLVNQTDTDNAWIRIRLVGRQATRDAIGANVTVKTRNTTRMAPLISGDGFYCASERVLHFGLGKIDAANDAVHIQIRWPNGDVQETSAACNGRFLVVQGNDAFQLDGSRDDG
jgi:tetratricopeptide (TPR) repeat protein